MKYNYEEVKLLLDMEIKSLNRIPTAKELEANDRFPKCSKGLDKFYKKIYNVGYADYYRDKGYCREGDILYKDKYYSIRNIDCTILVELIREFISIYNYFPKSYEFRSDNNLPSYTSCREILKKENKTLDDVANVLKVRRMTNNEGYEYWLNKLKDIIGNGNPLEYREFLKNKLPDARWYIENCDNLEVKTFNDFVRLELNMIPTTKMNKCDAIKLIKIMELEFDNPLMYDDFRCENTQKSINISTINRIWGTMNNMKKELGLEIIQEDMLSREKSKEDMLIDMQKLINELERLPLASEVDSCNYMNGCCCYHKYFGGINNVFIMLGYIPNKKSIALNMSNDEIISMYKEFIEETGFSPSSEYARTTYRLPSPSTVLRRFDCTWNEFITMLGYEPNKSMCNHTTSNDGTICLSVNEAIVHNYMLENNFKNIQKEILYRDILSNEKLQEESGLKRLDWTFEHDNKVYYVELFGMMGFQKYTERHNEKIRLITEDGKLDNFISIYPSDLRNLDKILKPKEEI